MRFIINSILLSIIFMSTQFAAKPAIAQDFSAEAEQFVNNQSHEADRAESFVACINAAWSIEVRARQIDAEYGQKAEGTTHWMRLRHGEMKTSCNRFNGDKTCKTCEPYPTVKINKDGISIGINLKQ